MVHRYSLFYYLLLIILVSSSIVLGIVIFGNRNFMSRILLSHQAEKFEYMTQAATEGIELRLTNVEGAIRRNAYLFTEEMSHSRKDAEQILRQTLGSFPTIYAMEIIFTQDALDVASESGFHAIYAFRKSPKSLTSEAEQQEESELSAFEIVDREDIETDYAAAWFTEPMSQQKAVWSQPYTDPQIDVLMITFSVPVFHDGKIEAIMTADVSLEWLDHLIETFPISETGIPILITPDQIIYRSEQGSKNTLSLVDFADVEAEDVVEVEVANGKRQTQTVPQINLSEFLRSSPSGKILFTNPMDQEPSWLYYSTLPKISWKLGCIVSEKKTLESVHRMTHWLIRAGLIGVVLLMLPSFWIARSVARPLAQLSNCAHHVAAGQFDEELPKLNGNGEIPQLFNAFDTMRGDLKRYIHDITEAAANEANMHSQLQIAHSIQQGMVPKNFEPARQGHLDLFAQMTPAQDVGGDLYDYDVLDDGNVYFCLGDVSGKGIPASLFMAIGKTLIRSAIQRDGDPAHALTWVNNQLMANNEAGLFITALCGVYNPQKHEIIISCAGHNPPFIRNTDGRTEMVNITNGKFPLAIMEDVDYENFRIPLPNGSTFFIYSDGVTDAANPAGDYFGEANLQKFLGTAPDDSTKSLVESMMTEITRFADGAKQSDDITILAFKEYTGNAPSNTTEENG